MRHGFRAAAGAQTNGYPNALQRGYRTLVEARLAWEHAVAAGTVGDPTAVPSANARAPVHPTPRTFAAARTIHDHKSKRQQPSSLIQPHPTTRIGSPSAVPNVSTSSSQTLIAAPRNLSYISAPRHPLTDEEVYWVVSKGVRPGVYFGR